VISNNSYQLLLSTSDYLIGFKYLTYTVPGLGSLLLTGQMRLNPLVTTGIILKFNYLAI